MGFIILKTEMRRLPSKWRPETGRTRRFAFIRCDCGVEKWTSFQRIKDGRTKSCGCLSVRPPGWEGTHKLSHSSEYKSWDHMKGRCNNPKNHKYPIYGGRGIRVCERWQSFENFYEDMGPKPAKNLTIERIDVNGNYEPGNCRWATNKEQCRNKRNSRYVSIGGEKKLLIDVAKEMNLHPSVAAYRFGFTFRTPKKRSLMHLLDPQ